MYVAGKIRLPSNPKQWPNQDEALAWHRTQFEAQISSKTKASKKKSKK